MATQKKSGKASTQTEIPTVKGKTAIVTGSTSGIGLGIAHALAGAGANIVFNGFGDPKEIKKLVADTEKKFKIKTHYSNADMSKPADIAKMVKDAEKKFGSVDILVNNAGIQFTALTEDFPDEKWDQIIAINMSATFHATKAVLKGMKKRKWGRIINIASAHGLVASPNKVAYVTAKHGVVGMTKVVALEAAQDGITANAICPGWVYTPLVEKQVMDNAKKQKITPAKAKEALLEAKMPTMEFTTVEEIGGLALFLCSDAAKNITGTTQSIDGGWTAE